MPRTGWEADEYAGQVQRALRLALDDGLRPAEIAERLGLEYPLPSRFRMSLWRLGVRFREEDEVPKQPKNEVVQQPPQPTPTLEGVLLKRVATGWVVVRASVPVDAPGLTLLNPGEGRPLSLGAMAHMLRLELANMVRKAQRMVRGAA